MVELAIAGDERFGLDRADLDRPGPSYTVDTLDILRARWGAEAWIGFIIGWDMLLSLPEWHDSAGVLARLDALIVARRPGATDEAGAIARLEAALPGLRERLTPLDAPQLEISSTWLRERVATGLPVRYLTPDPVRAYISRRGLYLPDQGSGAPEPPEPERAPDEGGEP
jgi:nicotinate-nucleotide adenylyltransferase